VKAFAALNGKSMKGRNPTVNEARRVLIADGDTYLRYMSP
jgi:hypothetical protein